MSYEYSITLSDSALNADGVIRKLRQCRLIVHENENCIALKDPNSRNTWAYDLRVFKVSENVLLLEVTNTTSDLYESVRSALPSNYLITEIEDEEELSLARVFRLN